MSERDGDLQLRRDIIIILIFRLRSAVRHQVKQQRTVLSSGIQTKSEERNAVDQNCNGYSPLILNDVDGEVIFVNSSSRNPHPMI